MKPCRENDLPQRRRRGTLAARLLLTSALGAAAAGAPAMIPPAAAQVGSARSFDIPAQPLASALNAFGRQSGLQVSMAATVARDMSSRPVQGVLTADQEGLRFTLMLPEVTIGPDSGPVHRARCLEALALHGRPAPASAGSRVARAP